ncbi:DUF4037 domain-containing protein [Cloacibacillus evryensis]|uniref:DUF4037 domain-containing protein n=1 Tax=Cloacibacillus evryensis TaxID=508460 RepID=A0AAW5K8L3_9BACT|nr:DUF4037 domain-containing protein [Cloacibacillus evryensis]EHL69045.1 hypothetical protein HMPREF1006_02699 [Synergistes sp. 3_1_syn1]MCQ4815485.1 DUF4037 domain-containing protein [Cloacibacillus evryensis]
MPGLELCRQFYLLCGAPLIERTFGENGRRFAAGLAGAGSDCLGFDDELSRDHDFGPGFCLWLTDEDDETFGGELRRLYSELPRQFGGCVRNTTPQGADRVGVMRIGDFYRRYTGCRDIPEGDAAWLRIPEHLLAAAVSGEVFRDGLGEFSRIRSGLLPCYPEDVRLKKLAARLFTMAQAGQYNYGRIMKRHDAAAAALALSEFARAALSAVHLLNRRYMPYYKWAFRSARRLPLLSDVVTELDALFLPETDREALIETICSRVSEFLKKEGLSSARDTFLIAHAEEVTLRIKSAALRNMGIMVG